MEDYPLLPVRRRFWEHTLRAVDRAGTAGQLRTQLRIVYDAIRRTAEEPIGTVVPADFLFEEISANLLQSGVLLREVNETIIAQDDGTPDGQLKSRLCALVFLIRKLPREAGVDIGVRATTETLADLLVKDLATDGSAAARSASEAVGRVGCHRYVDEAGRRIQPADAREQRVGSRIPQSANQACQRSHPDEQ